MNRLFKRTILWWCSRGIALWLFVTVLVCADAAVAEQHRDMIGVVTTQKTPLNLQNAPETHASILTTLPRGEFVAIAETVDEWYHIQTRVKHEVLTGYVSRRYITVLPTITDVHRASDGTVSLHGTFPKNTPVLLLSSGQKGASQITTTQDAYTFDFTPEITFDLTHLEMQTPAEPVIAAIVGKEAATSQYAYHPLTDADDAVKARFAQAWHDDQCADIAYDAESVPFGYVKGMRECPESADDLNYRIANIGNDRFLVRFEPSRRYIDTGYGGLAVFYNGVITVLSSVTQCSDDVHVFSINQRVYVKYWFNGCENGVSAWFIEDISGDVPLQCSGVDISM